LNGEGFSMESNCCWAVTFNCRQSFNQSSPVWTLNLLTLSTFQGLWWFQSIVAKLTFFTLRFTFFYKLEVFKVGLNLLVIKLRPVKGERLWWWTYHFTLT
jgi:hypothetical protein